MATKTFMICYKWSGERIVTMHATGKRDFYRKARKARYILGEHDRRYYSLEEFWKYCPDNDVEYLYRGSSETGCYISIARRDT